MRLACNLHRYIRIVLSLQGKEYYVVEVLVVDDSSFARRAIVAMLEKDPDINVAGVASNGEQAVELARKLDPDVITLDVEMPRMNGLTALKIIMAETPCPVIMISSLTSEGAETTLKAMDLGALDFMPKFSGGAKYDMQLMEKELRSKVKVLARRKAFLRLMFRRSKRLNAEADKKPLMPAKPVSALAGAARPAQAAGGRSSPVQRSLAIRTSFDAVAIGVSTGGPPAVQKILSALPAGFPAPILIAQHMPASFTGPFAKRLDAQCDIAVVEAEPSQNLRPGTVYICPGGRHMRIERSRSGLLAAIVTEEPRESLYKPSANVLMESAGNTLGRRALGVTLTGMGNDGLEGTRVLKQKGGWAIAQSEATCVVYGMPKAIVDAKLADEIVDLDDMATTIIGHFAK